MGASSLESPELFTKWGSVQVGEGCGYQSADTCKSGWTVISAGLIAIMEADEAPVTHVTVFATH